MDNNFQDDEENQDEEDGFVELKESIREIKEELGNQVRDLKEEIEEIKTKSQPDRPIIRARTRRHTRRPDKSFPNDDESWENWGENVGKSIEHYIGGILDSVGDTIDRTVGSIFQIHPSRRKGRRKKEPFFISEEDLDEFFQKGAAIMGALSDQTRLRMLKELEKQPQRQSDLSEKTNTRGGNFKHHINILKDEGLVRQEGVRERYMLTFAGREALKLVEFLYSRAKKRISIPVYSTDEEDEKQEHFDEEE